MLGLLEREPERQLIGDRRVQHAEGADQAIVAELFLQGRVEGARAGLVGDHVDAAAGGVAAVERALGTAQHLDPVYVVERSVGAIVPGLVDAVDVEGHRRIQGRGVVVGPDAADVDLGVDVVLAQHDGRRQVADLAHVGDARLDQLGTADRGDREGDLLDVFRAFLRGDHHLLQGRAATVGRGGLGGQRLLNAHQPGQRRRSGQHCPNSHRALPLSPARSGPSSTAPTARLVATLVPGSPPNPWFPTRPDRCVRRRFNNSLRIATRWSSQRRRLSTGAKPM